MSTLIKDRRIILDDDTVGHIKRKGVELYIYLQRGQWYGNHVTAYGGVATIGMYWIDKLRAYGIYIPLKVIPLMLVGVIVFNLVIGYIDLNKIRFPQLMQVVNRKWAPDYHKNIDYHEENNRLLLEIIEKMEEQK